MKDPLNCYKSKISLKLSIFLPNAQFFFVLRLTVNLTETFFKQVTNPSYSIVLHSLSSIITPLTDY